MNRIFSVLCVLTAVLVGTANVRADQANTVVVEDCCPQGQFCCVDSCIDDAKRGTELCIAGADCTALCAKDDCCPTGQKCCGDSCIPEGSFRSCTEPTCCDPEPCPCPLYLALKLVCSLDTWITYNNECEAACANDDANLVDGPCKGDK